ncbi:low temperature requirement protein A [Rugosimonospora africana]|uniref:Membrane protein n=1 Tax=Rugosimonospora africana TaxID=556532 RepID=A0A8J3QVM6_9ACTN|nr:low temperature requirement protein A [Rugosimonospora africana]GIH15621.1 membrane protein [Rugosimonospora africana]
MSTGQLPRILRKQDTPGSPLFVELFFDLVYIFFFTRLSQSLQHQVSLRDTAQTAVLLLAGWWVWVLTAWLTDLFDAQLPLIRGLVIVVMVGTLVMAAVIPKAFGEQGLLFVLAYFGIHVARDAVLIPGTRVNRDIQARSVRVFFWLLVTAVPWLLGAFLHGPVRLLLWAVAVLTDFLSAMFGWPTPRLGRTDLKSSIFLGGHLSERHRQIVIVAFGELVLTAGFGLGDHRIDVEEGFVFLLAFGSAVLLFQLYYQQIRRLIPPASAGYANQVATGTFTSYWHLVMVAGVVGVSVTDRILAADPHASTPVSSALIAAGGPAVFLIGSCLFDRVVTGRVPWTRWVPVLVLLALVPALLTMPLILVAVTTYGVLLLTLITEALASRRRGTVEPRSGS